MLIIGISYLARIMMNSEFEEKFEQLLKKEQAGKYYVRETSAIYKVKLYLEKAKNSFTLAKYLQNCEDVERIFVDYWLITVSYYSMLYAAKAAVLSKGYETDDHYATQVALAYLLVPDKLEKEDLELLEQSHKLFEEEYVEYFEDARKESQVARYAALKKYSERRVKDIMTNAQKFIAKIELVLEG